MLAHEGTYPILYGSYDLPVGAGHSPGYLARPDQAGRFPAVLVLPDSGLSSHHKDLCRRLARHGLAAIAIDLDLAGSGVVGEAHEFVMANDWAIKDRFGIIGLGAGGGSGLIYAADNPEVRAVAVVSTDLADGGPLTSYLPRLNVPLLGLFGSDEMPGAQVDDGRIPNGWFVVYSGVSAGFMDAGAAAYDAAAAVDAYRRLVEFFGQSLPAAQIEVLG